MVHPLYLHIYIYIYIHTYIHTSHLAEISETTFKALGDPPSSVCNSFHIRVFGYVELKLFICRNQNTQQSQQNMIIMCMQLFLIQHYILCHQCSIFAMFMLCPVFSFFLYRLLSLFRIFIEFTFLG
jgi:hypothetical protein